MALITISGGVYSGGKELAQTLSERLGYRLVSQEQLLPPDASHLVMASDDPETASHEGVALWKGSRLQKLFYLAYLQVSMCEDARSDGVVYYGQMAHYFLRGIPHHLAIRVVADLECRINTAMKYRLFSREKASELIKSRDDEKDRWARDVYSFDRNDPSLYDVVFDSSRIAVADASQRVRDVLEKEIRTTPESLRAIDDLILAAELRTKIALDGAVDYDDIQIEVHHGVVTIKGVMASSDDADKLRLMIRQHPGVADIDSKLAVRWAR